MAVGRAELGFPIRAVVMQAAWHRRRHASHASQADTGLLDLNEQRQAFEHLELDANAKRFLESVWLRYVVWWDRRARQARRPYRFWRSVVLIGGAVTPSLIGFSIGGESREAMQWAAWVTGLAVAFAAALEALFRWGDVWREKRAAGEMLKIEGWRFFQLIGPYRGRSHAEAFPDFAEAVEWLVEHEIGDYLVAATPRPGEGGRKDEGDASTTRTDKNAAGSRD